MNPPIVHLDEQVLAELKALMGPRFPRLVDIYLTDSEQRLQQLVLANGETLQRLAHSLKGSCSNMGASHLADLCRQLESQALLNAEPTHISATIECVMAEFSVVKALYKPWLVTYG